MGNNLIHFNTCAISYIVSATNFHLYKMYDAYKAREVKNGREDNMNFIINTDIMNRLMTKTNICQEDRVLMLQVFQLLDVTGFDEVNIRDFLACFALVVEDSLEKRIRNAINNYFRDRETCTKKEIYWLLKLLNETCYFFGDKKLIDSQVGDLVDSIFTLAGKLDGSLTAEETYDLLISHPILEMFISMQYQGTDRSVVEA